MESHRVGHKWSDLAAAAACLLSVPVLSFSLCPLYLMNERMEMLNRGHSSVVCFGGWRVGQEDTNLPDLKSCVSVLPVNSWGNVQPYSLRTKNWLPGLLVSPHLEETTHRRWNRSIIRSSCLVLVSGARFYVVKYRSYKTTNLTEHLKSNWSEYRRRSNTERGIGI